MILYSQYFISPLARWRYVLDHSTRAAWTATLKTLVVDEAPLYPVGLLYTETWLETPTLLIATSQGATVRILAEEVPSSGHAHTAAIASTIPTSSQLTISVPGAALTTLPEALRENWNTLLQTKLGFTATTPDVVAELAHYSHVTLSITDEGGAVGVRSEAPAERARWATVVEEWVGDEDRFRRPIEQAFRLPDGTLGRERVAGLPSEVWQEASGGCRTPVPGKPTLWLCGNSSEQILASYFWQPKEGVETSLSSWEIVLGQDFLASLPGVGGIALTGGEQRAAGVITLSSPGH